MYFDWNIVFVHLLQESHFTLHISQSVIYTDFTKPNPHAHSALLILMTCNFSADATGPTFQDETDENDGWVPNTGFSSIGHLPKRPKCALINKNHIAPGICLFSLNLPSISTWHRKKSYPNGWREKIGVSEPGNDGATINKHKWASWSFICSFTYTLYSFQSSFLMVFSFALSYLHR